MVGIVGTLGDIADVTLDSHIRWSDRERSQTYDTDQLTIRGSFHCETTVQPVTVLEDSVSVWTLGQVYGHNPSSSPEDYRPKPRDVDSTSFLASIVADHGIDGVEGVNGNYLGIVHDTTRGKLFVITDRLGTIPIFHASTSGGHVLATSIQTVANHPHVETKFDIPYLHEYFVFKRPFGLHTPLQGIAKLPPGSVTEFDVDTGARDSTSYWQPRYEPLDKPFSSFVDQFVETFETIMDEWMHPDRRYGLLLSGGSDSRLCLGAMAARGNVTAMHMSGWMSREARMAERAALSMDVPFDWLRRHESYQATALERNPRISNFNGWFSQGYVTGFHDRIIDQYDTLVTGMYADTLFKGHAIPTPSVQLGRLGEFSLPIEDEITSVDDFIDWMLDGVSDELALPTDLRTVLEENIITESDGSVTHHGITYDRLEDLIHCSSWYPLTNDDDMIFAHSLHHLRPYRSPYLDNRMIDLALSMPRRYQLRRNIINRALERIAPTMAEIPHAHTGIKPSRSFIWEYIGSVSNAFWQKHVRVERPPRRFLSNGPWVNDVELLRTHDFARTTLERHKDLIDTLPFLEWENVSDCYERHQSGENRIVELYGLLTFLEMPVTQRIAYPSSPSAGSSEVIVGERVSPSVIGGGGSD